MTVPWSRWRATSLRENMRRTGWRLLVAVSALGLAIAAMRPRYGAVLHLEIRERLATLEGSSHFETLIFDRLVRIGDGGHPQPALALSWQADNEQKRWEFRLRPGVKFHDGYPLAAATVGGALQRLLGSMANVAVAGDVVIVKSDRAMPGLLAELARPAASVVARSPDGVLLGTGPFRVARFDAGRHLSLA